MYYIAIISNDLKTKKKIKINVVTQHDYSIIKNDISADDQMTNEYNSNICRYSTSIILLVKHIYNER